MPIWFEIVALMLVAYGIGLTIGWALWGRTPADDGQADIATEGETE